MVRGSDTSAAVAARRAAAADKVRLVVEAVRQMRAERAIITVAAVAVRAAVSRTFLYENTQARSAIASARVAPGNSQKAAAASAAEGSWRERALNAEASLKLAYGEIRQQRQRIGELLGRIRDLECDLPPDGLQRLVSENTSLRRDVSKLQASSADLEQRLAASRENVRFQDHRVAALQAENLELRGLSPALP